MKKIIISLVIILLVGIIVIFITNIDTTKAATTTLSDKVISLSQGDSWSSGASGVYQTNGHEYRYVGANVNNYVSFNNDLYRIIGVFDSNSTGVSGNLVKLIRTRSIGGYSWGVYNAAPEYTTYSGYSNNWETANANILLNEYFLNATDTSATYKSCSDWTYYYSITNTNYKTNNCSDIIGYGIQTTYLRNYIQPVTWYLKGYNSEGYDKQNFYTCERSDATTIENCTSGNSGAYATKIENKKVGLMYVSDYMYACGNFASTSYIMGSIPANGRQNWLYNGIEWTITPKGDSSNRAFYIYLGYVNIRNHFNSQPFALRPTFYLKEQVYVTGGDGSFHNPYTIACDTCNE